MLQKRDFKKFDVLLLTAVLALSIFGIIAIGSADHINLPGIDKGNYYKQIGFFVAGIFLLFGAAFVNYIFFAKFYPIYYALIISLLIATLLFGTKINNATRWLEVAGVGIQPSEFSKLILIFINAKLIEKFSGKINNFFVLLLLTVLTLIPTYLIMKQPSLSTSLVLVFVLACQLFAGGLSFKIVAPVLALVVSAFALIFADITRSAEPFIVKVGLLEKYQVVRILSTIYPERYPQESYQTIKSIEALASGLVRGKGLYQGTLNQLSYLPEPNNDFIFAVIGEEFGFVGCTAVLLVLLFVISRCLFIAIKSQNFLGKITAAGVASMLFFQTFVNTGVASGILPNTGMGLPFVSSGGSALLTNMIAIGLVLNIGMIKPKSLFEEA